MRGRLTRRELLRAGALAALAAACGSRREPEQSPPDEILAFHRESPVFDLHIDTLLWTRLMGYDLGERHTPLLPRAAFGGHMDLPRAAEAGLDGAVLGIVVNPQEVRPELMFPLRALARIESERGFEQTLSQLDLMRRTAERLSGAMRLALSGSELRAAIADGRFAALAGLEGAHGIEDELDNVRVAHRQGLRMLGLVHFQSSAAAHPMTAPDFDDQGLTPFGFDLLAEMESLGMVVDLAHVNRRGVDDALAAMKRPFVVSHTACRAVHDMARNLDDDQIRRVADRGGVVGIAMGRWFLGRPGLDSYLDHVDHAMRVGGTEAVALGSDWDGAITPVEGLEDVGGLPYVTWGLLERGWSTDAVRKVLGENALRVITEVCG